MTDTVRTRRRNAVPRHPLHALLVPIPAACFVGALITDIVYSRSPDMQWANFSAWLLAIGLMFGILAGIAGAVDFFMRRGVRTQAAAWPHAIGNVLVLVLALFNNFVHSRDAWTSVVPTGLILSAATVLVMIVTMVLGRAIVDQSDRETAR